VIKLAVLYGGEDIPFEQNNFALTKATNLWQDAEAASPLPQGVPPMKLTLKTNDFEETVYHYKLAGVHISTLTDEYDDEYDIGCTILQFMQTED